MQFTKAAAAVAATLLLCGASGAQAATINVGGNVATTNIASYQEVNFDFALPTNFTDASLSVSSFFVDDRGILLLNGTIIDSGGIG